MKTLIAFIMLLAAMPAHSQILGGVVSANGTPAAPQVATPTFSQEGGSCSPTCSITISDTDSGLSGFAMQYCLQTGSNCTPGTSYTGAVTVDTDTQHLCAFATATGYTQSATHCQTYSVTASNTYSISVRSSSGNTITSQSVNVPSGATVVVFAGANSTCNGTTQTSNFGSVSGTGGDSFTLQEFHTESFACAAAWTKTSATANATYAVTINLGTVSWAGAQVLVAVIPSGTSIADHKNNFNGSTSPNTLPTITASANGTLVDYIVDYYADTFASSAGSGLTDGTRVTGSTGTSFYAYRSVTAAGYTPGIDITGSKYTIHVGVIVQ